MACRHDSITIVEDQGKHGDGATFNRDLSRRIDAMHHALNITAAWPDSHTKRCAVAVLRRRLRALEQEAGL